MEIPCGCSLATRRPRFQHSDVSGRHHFQLPNATPPTVVTLTTVGYGNISPNQVPRRPPFFAVVGGFCG